MKKSRKPKSFDWEELGEALDYFVMRFSSRDVTISKLGKFITIGVGGGPWPEFVVTPEPGGWTVWRDEGDFQKLLASPARSYEQAAIAIEKDLGWYKDEENDHGR